MPLQPKVQAQERITEATKFLNIPPSALVIAKFGPIQGETIMLQENRYFQGILTRIASKAKDEEVLLAFNIRHTMEGEIQNFLLSYAQRCAQPNIRELFYTPVQWKGIHIEAAYKFKVTFDALEFDATLKSIKVRRAFKKNTETFTYDLGFEKSLDKDTDLVLPTFLNQKETDENGKKKLVLFDIMMEPLEALMKQ